MPQPLLGRVGFGQGKDVTLLQAAVPAPQSIETLLFLFKLAEGELLFGDLAGDLFLVLAAVGLELVPLVQPSRPERVRDQSLTGLRARTGIDHSEHSPARLSELFRPLERTGEGRRCRHRPGSLRHGHSTALAQLPPDRHPVTGRFRGQLHEDQNPTHICRHDHERNVRHMKAGREHTLLDRTFFISLILKGLDGVLELVGGVALLLVTPAQIAAAVRALTRHELSEDPHDLIANWLITYSNTLDVSATLFGAIYLLLHGIVKVFLVVAVLRDRLWAYPWLIGFLVLFIGYQGYELILHFSWGLLLLTAFDIFIVMLTAREYRLHKRRRTQRIDLETNP